MFAAIANRPTADAVLAGDGESWRAAELLAAVDDLAGQLAGCRVVAVLADNGPAWVIAEADLLIREAEDDRELIEQGLELLEDGEGLIRGDDPVFLPALRGLR
ncbi:MAG TPA: hypothetical protein PLV92_29945, partial [Pirellulaceae bacterium]|nr:hypothetical protein [Pirellulaceae bacterium]